MRMKLQAMAACAVLAVAASNANADPIPPQGLYLSIWDQTTSTSFLANLSITTSAFLTTHVNGAQNYALTGSALSALDTYLDGLTDLSGVVWNVLGTLDSPKGGLTTVFDIATLDLSFGITDQGFTAVNQFAELNNEFLATSNGVAFTDVRFIQDFGSPSLGFNSEGVVNSALDFYQLIGGTRTGGPGQLNQLAGFFTLGYLNGTASLGYTAVPIPAAVWLLFSGLLGLAGVARRSRA